MIYDIPCYLRNAISREGVRKTLQQILDRNPKDFRRLQRLVREIQPYDDADDGTLGIWVEDKPVSGDPATWDYGYGETPGVLKIVEDSSIEELPGLIAHELGHAATREEDLERRGALEDEWQSELAADWYAYKWGFGRQIARMRKTRDHMHHGPPPGSTFELPIAGMVNHYRVTRNFVAHPTHTTLE